MSGQVSLFDNNIKFPDGFSYLPDYISTVEEKRIISSIKQLPFKQFNFHGYLANRRTVSFGWHYDFTDSSLKQAKEIPEYLKELRKKAAKFAGVKPSELPHVLVTEYKPGAAIGWHKDKGVFDIVVGISLLSDCNFRLRKKLNNGKWERVSFTAEARSIYVISGESRTGWEHSIPAVEKLRYSITFRTLKG
jgi:alkylated DNA repair dioxygenase AlkB